MSKPSAKKAIAMHVFCGRCLVLLLTTTFINSCENSPGLLQANVAVKTSVVPAKKQGAFPPPKVTLVTDANKPVVIKAGKPVAWPDSLNRGAPFFVNFGVEQELTNSAINCMIQDRLGNIWFATEGAGASRYDGKNFTTYTRAQGLGSNSVTTMLEDQSGNIWFGTSGGGVSRYDGKSFKTFRIEQGLGGNILLSIFQDKAGNIWFGIEGGGASKYDGKKFTRYTGTMGLAGNSALSINQDNDGNIWMGTQSGLSCYNGKTFVNYSKAQGLAGNAVTHILKDNTGQLWFGTDEGISRFDGKTFRNYTKSQGLANQYIDDIIQDKKGTIWVATYAGVSQLVNDKFVNYTKNDGLADNKIAAMLQDRAGSIWFGSIAGGINRYDGNSFASFTPLHGTVGNFANKIFQDKDGAIWFGTNGGGVIVYDGKTFKNYTTAQGLVDGNVAAIMQAKDSSMWFGTTGGLSHFDGKTFTNYTSKQGLGASFVPDIVQDNSGNIWFGTWGGGVSSFDGKSFTTYTTAQGLAFNIADVAIKDKNGNIWFGTGGGVSRFNGNNFTNYTTAQGLLSNVIISAMQDQSGDLWFGTDGGMSRFDGSSISNSVSQQWMDPKNEVYNIAEDTKRGLIWFGDTEGLAWYKPGPADSGQQGHSFETFDASSDYPVRNVNGLLVDNKGVIWAECGNNKIVRFDYDALPKNSAPSKLELTRVKVNGEDICWNNLAARKNTVDSSAKGAILNEMVTTFGKTLPVKVLDSMRHKYRDVKFDSVSSFYPVPVNLTLPYSDRNLTFEFTAIAPEQAKQVKYTYKLEGYDKNWSVPGNSTTAVFGNIPEGDYTFRLTARSKFGVPSEMTYKFTVLPPWYRTWWAWLAYIALAIASFWVVANYRSRHLVRQKRLLEHEVDVRTEEVTQQKVKIESQRDDLEKSLTQLKATQNQLIQAEKMASLGELATGIAHEIQNPLNFVNNFSELNREMISELEEELKTGNINEAMAIAADLKLNEDKITHHGKRAGSIVRGMLEHSSSIGVTVKEETDINKLTAQYLKLAYDAFQANNERFKIDIIKNFSPDLPLIKIVQQDMGKALLHIFNNAFYAVHQKAKIAAEKAYKPTVEITTFTPHPATGGWALIVRDNGTGIADNIKDKIMQPFFTTKPTGQGTGLGLSLTYDIIVKEHSGTINVVSMEGEYSEFVITIPA
jgi:ligand-binding sensor domain-containing protein/signal transduction histidine kinase